MSWADRMDAYLQAFNTLNGVLAEMHGIDEETKAWASANEWDWNGHQGTKLFKGRCVIQANRGQWHVRFRGELFGKVHSSPLRAMQRAEDLLGDLL